MTDAGEPYIDAILAQGIPVVRSSKIGNGFVVPQGNCRSRLSLSLGWVHR